MKHKELIEQMTLEEKCGLLSGRDIWSTRSVERLGVPTIYLSDGPTGMRKQVGEGDHLGLNASLPATCWPTAVTVACTWDPALGEELGAALGEEAVAQGVSVVLGPGLNIQRSPLCGRNFEYFSEDPILAGKLAAGYIRGIQSRGIAACPKHFAANSQETLRMASDSVVDERTFREVYLTNYEIAVKEGKPKFIMSSYNKINGTYANEDKTLLSDILRDEWGFEGAVVTDWGGSNDHVEGVRAGSHLEMPGTAGDSDRQLAAAVKAGVISEEVVDQRVDELLDVILAVAPKEKADGSFDKEGHHALAAKVAEEAVVLLKNEENILPLAAGAKVAVIGDFAANPRYQGAGSSLVNPTKLECTLDVLDKMPLESVGYAQGFTRADAVDKALTEQAVALAKQADTVLLYMGLPEISETEGLDREHMRLPDNQVQLLKAVAAANPNVVVVLAAGSPVETPWLEHCKALVYTGLCGQAGASAALRVITGQVCPGGRLSQTWPLEWADEPVSHYWPGRQRTAEYREGPFVGYRYFETANKPVRFAFGYGLSYTTFAYSDLAVSETEVSFTLTNTGSVAGAEVAQVYVGKPGSAILRPAKELKGFAKVRLAEGESRRVTIPLDDKAFRWYDVQAKAWKVEGGEYTVMVGSSCADIRLTGSVNVAGEAVQATADKEALACYYDLKLDDVPDEAFAALLGREVPEGKWDETKLLEMNDAICQMYYARNPIARLAGRILTNMKEKSIANGKPDLNILFIYNMPFRGIAKMMNGMVSMEMAEGILVMVNGHFFKGLGQVWRGWRSLSRIAKAEKNAAKG